jgi:anthranilate phosphoribosyltransferase
MVGEYKDGEIREYEIHPERLRPDDGEQPRAQGGDARAVACVHAGRAGQRDGPARDIVLLNAGVALYCRQRGATMADGVAMAREALASGKALAKLSQFVARAKELAGA